MVVASRQQASRHGPGRLIVDGLDSTVIRKATFAFRPTPKQERALLRLLDVSREVYNAALQERRDAWRLAGVTVTWQDQFKQVTCLRGVRDDALVFGIQPLRGAIMRCDEAMQGFFRRARAGHTPGYPRFKSWRRYHTVCWDEPVSWSITPDAGILRIQGVGDIRLPRSARRQLGRLTARGGQMRTLTVTRRRAGGTRDNPRWVWRATVGFRDVAVEPTAPTCGTGSVVGVDRGVKVTAATSDGDLLAMPGYAARMRERIVDLERARARKQKGSREHDRLGRRVARARRKAACQVDDWARTVAARLVDRYDVLAVEDLRLAAMTRSAKGTVDEPGTNVAATQGLNRALQDAALGKLAYRVCVKAESAGRRVWAVDPGYTSQRCPRCSHTSRHNRPVRDVFACGGCGHVAHADVNVAASARDCEQAWAAAGRTPLHRRRSRRRPGTTSGPAPAA